MIIELFIKSLVDSINPAGMNINVFCGQYCGAHTIIDHRIKGNLKQIIIHPDGQIAMWSVNEKKYIDYSLTDPNIKHKCIQYLSDGHK